MFKSTDNFLQVGDKLVWNDPGNPRDGEMWIVIDWTEPDNEDFSGMLSDMIHA